MTAPQAFRVALSVGSLVGSVYADYAPRSWEFWDAAAALACGLLTVATWCALAPRPTEGGAE